ncbi:Putative transposase (fragment) [Bradyrhizobium sp. ORS 285]
MKRKRFTEEQIIAVLKEPEAGAKTADLARKHGISEATLYNWKAKFGGMDVSEAKRLKALEDENAKLKKLLAEQMLDAAALRELFSKRMVGPAAKRAAAAHLQAKLGLSERRACSIVGADRTMVLYQSRRSSDAELRADCASLPTNGGGSAIVGCSSCCDGRANDPASSVSIGCTAMKGLRCASDALVERRSGCGLRSRWKRDRMRAGRWTLSPTSSPTVGASGSSTSSMMSPRSVWARSRTPRSRAGGWHEN